MVGIVISPAVEAMLTKCPKPCLRKTGNAAAMPYRTPLRLTSIISSQSSTRRSSREEIGPMPALLTRTSSLPYRSQANLTRLDKSARAEHELRTALSKQERSRLADTTACARDYDYFVFDSR